VLERSLLLVVLCLGLGAASTCAGAPPPNPLIPNGAWADVLKSHPRLLGPPAYLKERAKEKPAEYAVMKSIVGNLDEAAGIVYAVEGLPKEQVQKYLDRALRNVSRGPTDLHQDTWIYLEQAAHAYDFFHDQFTPEQRKAIVDWMNAHLGTYLTDENAFHNSTLSKIRCYLKVAYATWGENPRAPEFRDYALKKLYEGKIVPVLLAFGRGGGYTECGWYTRHSLMHLVLGLELARRLEGYDGFQKAPDFFYQRLAYEMLQPYPGLWLYAGERFAVEGDGSSVYGGHVEYPRVTRTVLGQYFRGSELSRYVANKARQGSSPQTRLYNFLFDYDESPLPLASFPLAHFAQGIGKVFARGDWSDDASWLRFECGDYWCGHQHFESGNFEIFRYEPLLTESGEYYNYVSNHDVNWLLRTIAHNSMLVYMPGETWSQLRDGGRNAYGNDGGQDKKWDWTKDNLPEWETQRKAFERGDIVAYENRPEYLYVAGDCTAAYSPLKLESWVRQLVFLRPHTFVIFDRVVSAKPEYRKTWLLHSITDPEVDGTTTTIKVGKGTAVVRTLLPASPVIRKIAGYTYGGKTYDPESDRLRSTSGYYRVEVQPPAAAKEDLFLHVVFTDKVQPATLIQKDGQVGVRVGDSVVMFSGKVGGSVSLGGKRHPLQPVVNADPYG